MEYTLIRSDRKTIKLSIRDGEVKVRAPLKMPETEIDEFITSKQEWIKNELEISKEKKVLRENFKVDYGDNVTYRGELYPVVAREGDYIGFTGKQFYVTPSSSPEKIKLDCVWIYKMLAMRYYINTVLKYAKQLRVMPLALKVNSASAQWGSCSRKDSISFSWRLIMADDDAIDYVIVHELAHLLEMNHSSKFWAIVEGVFPDYKERINRLKELYRKLSVENW